MAKLKKSRKQVKQEVAKLLKDIKVQRNLARQQGHMFTSLNRKELEKKVKGITSNSPFIYGQTWIGGGTPGSSVYFTVRVDNPDPSNYYPFYATMFFGLGNFYDVDQAWIGRDQRWPAFSSNRISFLAGTTNAFTFNFDIPTGLTPGTYNGNVVLWRGQWHDVGTAFDRGSFDMQVL